MTRINKDTFEGEYSISGEIVTLRGKINDTIKGHTIRYMAASPADRRMSFSGSGLPYSSPQMAFGNSPSRGDIEPGVENSFEIEFEMPNSYYTNLGTNLICPSVYLKYENGIETVTINIELTDPIPYRMLTYPSRYTLARTNADFYQNILPLPVRTQEQILRDSAYPSKNMMHSNFWGSRPPV